MIVSIPDFMQMALVAGLLAAVLCGVLGPLIVQLRLTYAAGALSHAVLGGLAAASVVELRFGWFPLDGLFVASATGVGLALVIAQLSWERAGDTDSVLSALWAIGMSAGIVLLSTTPGTPDIMGFLFGNLLLLSTAQIVALGLLTLITVSAVLLWYPRWLALCLDREHALMRGVRAKLFYHGLLVLLSLAVVLLTHFIGIVLVLALLTLPAALARRFCRRLLLLMGVATGVGIASVCAGLSASYVLDWPTGPTIALVAGGAYGCACLLPRR